jgi:aminoglycoside phosphotransferase
MAPRDKAIVTEEYSVPDWAQDWVASLVPEKLCSVVRVRSNEVNAVFQLEYESRSLFLKIGPNLGGEYERLQWLEGRLPAPQPLGWTVREKAEALLLSAVPGDDLATLSVSVAPQRIVIRLAEALKAIHNVPVGDWPFGGVGLALVHGDACLPNFLYDGERLSGYIDIGDMALGSPEIDLAAAVYSLQRNLGPGYGLAFLHEYGWKDVSEDEVERLRLLY